MEDLQKKMGYEFKNPAYLEEALTHKSYANEHGACAFNERLEFLGDSVLNFTTANYLYREYPKASEGKLSKIRASLICTQSLAEFAKSLSLGSYIRFGNGEIATGGAERPRTLENTFEALVAAVFLDGGIEAAFNFVIPFLESELKSKHFYFSDYKSDFIEIMARNPDERYNFVIVGEEGPQHDKIYKVEIHINSNVIAAGEGKNKKDAEQNAARNALLLMGCIDE